MLRLTVMIGHRAGHLSPHVLTEITGSVAAHDGGWLRVSRYVWWYYLKRLRERTMFNFQIVETLINNYIEM
jgi:hypothetical protein